MKQLYTANFGIGKLNPKIGRSFKPVTGAPTTLLPDSYEQIASSLRISIVIHICLGADFAYFTSYFDIARL